MKNVSIILTIVILFFTKVKGQDKLPEGKLDKSKLERIYLTKDVSLHFVSPEPIQYVDLSSKDIFGDLPVSNVLRVKARKDTIGNYFPTLTRSIGIVTIVGEKFIAQYDVWYTNEIDREIQTQIEILPKNTNPLDVGATPLSKNDLRDYSMKALKKDAEIHAVKSSAYGIQAKVNNIYTVADYIFLDLSFVNRTNLKYDIDELRFKVDDKRITKATNVQSLEIKPVFQLNDKASFKKSFRNIYVLKKLTFPGNKVLSVEMSEKQVSGRIISLQLDYSDILNADTL